MQDLEMSFDVQALVWSLMLINVVAVFVLLAKIRKKLLLHFILSVGLFFEPLLCDQISIASKNKIWKIFFRSKFSWLYFDFHRIN